MTHLVGSIFEGLPLCDLFHDLRAKVASAPEMLGCKWVNHKGSLSRHPCINLNRLLADFTDRFQGGNAEELNCIRQCAPQLRIIWRLTSMIKASGCIAGSISFFDTEQVTGFPLMIFS